MDFRRECLSHSLSLLMPTFALLIPPGPLTGIPSQAYRTLRYRAALLYMTTEIKNQKCGSLYLGGITPPCSRTPPPPLKLRAAAWPCLTLVGFGLELVLDKGSPSSHWLGRPVGLASLTLVYINTTHFLISFLCHPVKQDDTRSFGTCLEPRYIFAARWLLDQ